MQRLVTVSLLACAVSLLSLAPATGAEPKLIVGYDADKAPAPQNPKDQGWIDLRGAKFAAEAKPMAKSADNELNAWQIVDDDAAGDEDLYYGAALPDDVRATAYDDGFSMRWRVRILTEGAPNRAVSTEACVGSGKSLLRFCFFLGREANSLTVQTILTPENTPIGKVDIAKADGYHVWTFIFDGVKNGGAGKLYVDDKLALSGKFNFQDNGDSLCFGSKSSGSGAGNWNRVEFFTGALPAPKAEVKAAGTK